MVRIILINVIDSKCAGRCIKPQCDSQTVSEGRWEIVSSSILWRTTFNGARTRSREGASVQRQRQPRRQAPRGEKSTARAIAKLKPIRLLCRKMMGGQAAAVWVCRLDRGWELALSDRGGLCFNHSSTVTCSPQYFIYYSSLDARFSNRKFKFLADNFISQIAVFYKSNVITSPWSWRYFRSSRANPWLWQVGVGNSCREHRAQNTFTIY